MSAVVRVLLVLLGIVAVAAVVLSFDALDSLARLCGFGALSPLLPVLLDVGAAAGTVAWLWLDGRPRAFGRVLALVLLATSVVGNAVGHAFVAYRVVPHWGVVVAVGALAPAVLGAVAHLAQLAAQGDSAPAQITAEPLPAPALAPALVVDERPREEVGGEAGADERVAALLAEGAGRRRIARELGVSEWVARQLIDARTRENGVPA